MKKLLFLGIATLSLSAISCTDDYNNLSSDSKSSFLNKTSAQKLDSTIDKTTNSSSRKIIEMPHFDTSGETAQNPAR